MHKRLVNWLSGLPPRQLAMLATAVALIVFAVVYTVLSSVTGADQTKNDAPAIITKNVVVAKSNISQKTVLKREMLQVKAVPESMVPPNAITDIDKLANRMTKTAIFAGDVFTEQKVYSAAEKGGFIGSIPPDCRAVSISINDVTGVAGFAKPGDYVDVMLVEKAENTAVSSLLLQNVLLLSINDVMGGEEKVEESEEEGKEDKNEKNDKNAKKKKGKDNNAAATSPSQAIANPTIATLALKPDEVLELVSASKLGEVYLMLRPDKPKNMYVPNDQMSVQNAKIVEPPKNAVQAAIQNNPNLNAVLNPNANQNVVPFKTENETSKHDPNKIEILYGDDGSSSKSEAAKK
ncbi:MAG: Flp pilus assembly protein CpaB [Selenomonadaceae bacterium]|nr:Flp pilus assembly protein CpaB [Selenomonadaceae bacterium]